MHLLLHAVPSNIADLTAQHLVPKSQEVETDVPKEVVRVYLRLKGRQQRTVELLPM